MSASKPNSMTKNPQDLQQFTICKDEPNTDFQKHWKKTIIAEYLLGTEALKYLYTPSVF